MNIDELNKYFVEHNYSTYDRTNFDNFLDEIAFSFNVKAIHITGSNGKGSVANYLYHIYLSQGYKVGLFVSPFAYSVTEMISVNNQSISEDEFISIFDEFKDRFEKYRLSSFEMETFIAYTYFSRQNLDLVIIEVGMGGFIDATNVINSSLSIITSVSLEHTSYLGRSVSEIAYNKAGIIKEDSIALVSKVDESALYAIKEYAKSLHSKVNLVNDHHNERVVDGGILFDYYPLKDLKINTLAMYQVDNASLAIEAVELLKEIIPVSESSIRKGLLSLPLMCRYEFIKKNVLLDGAHNPEAMEKLVNSLKDEKRPIHVIFASFKDKNIELMLIQLGLISDDITLTSFPHYRARKEEDYFLYLGDYAFNENYSELINSKINEFPNDLILVTGSLAFTYLVKKEL